MSKTIYTFSVSHAHGDTLSLHESQEGALGALASYVAGEWQREMPEGEEMPSNEGDAIEAYFHKMEGLESYSLDELELLP